jgi:hypothetical protein
MTAVEKMHAGHVGLCLLQCNQTFPDRIFDQLGRPVDIQFLGDIPSVCLYRLDADKKMSRNFLGCHSLSHKLQHFPLRAVREGAFSVVVSGDLLI